MYITLNFKKSVSCYHIPMDIMTKFYLFFLLKYVLVVSLNLSLASVKPKFGFLKTICMYE